MATNFVLAPAPNMTFAALPSGATYTSDKNSLIVITNGSVPDQNALVAAGCTALIAQPTPSSYQNFPSGAGSPYVPVNQNDYINKEYSDFIKEVVTDPTLTTNWDGLDHVTRVTPFLMGAPITWSGIALNAGLDVYHEVLHVCEFAGNTIALFSLGNPAIPVFLGRFSCGGSPRWCRRIGMYLIVCCEADSTLEVYDMSNLAACSKVFTIATGTNPKQFQIDGPYLYLACYGTNTIEKYRIDWLMAGQTSPVSITFITSVSVSAGPIYVTTNHSGLLVCSGASTGNVDVIGSVNMNHLVAYAVGAETALGSVEFCGEEGLLVTGKSGMLYTLNVYNAGSPATSIYPASLSFQPEMLLRVGPKRVFVASLTNPGTAGNLDYLDTSDLSHPNLVQSTSSLTDGLGFLAFKYAGGGVGYVYGTCHFSPFGLSVFEVRADWEADHDPATFERLFAGDAVLGRVQAAMLSLATKTTLASSNIGNAQDLVVCFGTGATGYALDDPSVGIQNPSGGGNPFSALRLLVNVSASGVAITNGFAGYSGTLAANTATLLMKRSYAGTAEWRKVF